MKVFGLLCVLCAFAYGYIRGRGQKGATVRLPLFTVEVKI